MYQYCMQTPKIFQDPSRIELRGGVMFRAVVAKALPRHLTYKCSKHAGKQQNVLEDRILIHHTTKHTVKYKNNKRNV